MNFRSAYDGVMLRLGTSVGLSVMDVGCGAPGLGRKFQRVP